MDGQLVPGQTHQQQQQQLGLQQPNSQRPSQRPSQISSDVFMSTGAGVRSSADQKAATIAVNMCMSTTGTRNCQPEMSYGELSDADLGGDGSINGSINGSGGNKLY